jgi:hypothetical protein
MLVAEYFVLHVSQQTQLLDEVAHFIMGNDSKLREVPIVELADN